MARQTHCKISTTSCLIQHHFNIFLPIEMQRLNTLLILTLASSANGYSLNARRNGHDSKLSTVNDRRVFLGSSVMAGFTFFTSMPAFANADLSMPSEAEQAEMQVRVFITGPPQSRLCSDFVILLLEAEMLFAKTVRSLNLATNLGDINTVFAEYLLCLMENHSIPTWLHSFIVANSTEYLPCHVTRKLKWKQD